jgi:hypothetical protein
VRNLVYAIPIFFALMGIEALVNRARFGAPATGWSTRSQTSAAASDSRSWGSFSAW